MAYVYPFGGADEQGKLSVWAKGREIVDKNGKRSDKSVWRLDICGAVMKYSEHGNTKSEFGWEIDHIKPTAAGGSDDLGNLQPLNWKNNRAKADTYPWSCGS